jgi:hypothetical protein
VAVVVAAKLTAQTQEKVVLVAVEPLIAVLKVLQEHGLRVLAAAAVGTTEAAAVAAVAPALLLSVIKTYIERNNNLFLII